MESCFAYRCSTAFMEVIVLQKIRVPRRSTRDAPSRESTSTRTSNKSDMTPWSDDDMTKRSYPRVKVTGSFNKR